MQECLEQNLPGNIWLNIGCGKSYWNNWINIDSATDIKTDFCIKANKLLFSDNYADVICAIHSIEHIYRWEVESVLLEWYRVLKKDGKLILELPSMDKICYYINTCLLTDRQMEENFMWNALWGDPNKKSEEMNHKWGYTFLQMKKLLKSVGFRNVTHLDPLYHLQSRDMRVETIK
jgi:predicted SAM-dependent methyltransferase